MLGIFSSIILAGVLSSSFSYAKTSNKDIDLPELGTLKHKDDYKSEMDCMIFNAGSGVIYVEDREKGPLMKLDGKVVNLSLSKKSKASNLSSAEKKGEKVNLLYNVDDLHIEILGEVTTVCTQSTESCDGTGYSVKMILKKGKKSKIVKGLFGGC